MEEFGGVIKLEKGKQLNKELLFEIGLYPAYNGGISHSGFTDTYNYCENTIIISQGGASAGFVNFVNSKFMQMPTAMLCCQKKRLLKIDMFITF